MTNDFILRPSLSLGFIQLFPPFPVETPHRAEAHNQKRWAAWLGALLEGDMAMTMCSTKSWIPSLFHVCNIHKYTSLIEPRPISTASSRVRLRHLCPWFVKSQRTGLAVGVVRGQKSPFLCSPSLPWQHSQQHGHCADLCSKFVFPDSLSLSLFMHTIDVVSRSWPSLTPSPYQPILPLSVFFGTLCSHVELTI